MEGWSSKSRHRIGQNQQEIKSVVSIRNLKFGHEKVENALVFIMFSECAGGDLGTAKHFWDVGGNNPRWVYNHKEGIQVGKRTNWAIQT